MSASPTIIFCGGGSLGHIAPSVAVADEVRRLRPDCVPVFLCSSRPDEAAMLRAAGYDFHTIAAGKFPRGVSLRLLTFPFLFVISFFQSLSLLRRLRPVAVFGKGGFVSVPPVLAARCLGIPIVVHASDSMPNLSDRLLGSVARTVCTGFPTEGFPSSLRRKILVTGNPIRSAILRGSRDAGCRLTGFSGKRPVLLVIGGSQGSVALNQAVEKSFDQLLALADIIHLTGKGKGVDRSHARYFVRPFVLDELPHLYALSDLALSRAGASALSELGALKKAVLVVPLEGVAHDHQLRNAESLADRGAVDLLRQSELSTLVSRVQALLSSSERRMTLGTNLAAAFPANAAVTISRALLDVLPARG